MKFDLIEIFWIMEFPIMVNILNNTPQIGKLLSRQISKVKFTNQVDIFVKRVF